MSAAQPDTPHPHSGELVSLASFASADLPALFEVLSHPEVYAGGWGGGPAAYTPEYGTWRKSVLRWMPVGMDAAVYTVRDLHGAPMGLTAVGFERGRDTLGQRTTAVLRWTVLAPRLWGGGAHEDLMLLLLDELFLGDVERVAITMDVLNARARASAERIGAVHEGTRRHGGRRADGTWRDDALYSVLRGEWPGVSERLRERRAAKSAPKVSVPDDVW